MKEMELEELLHRDGPSTSTQTSTTNTRTTTTTTTTASPLIFRGITMARSIRPGQIEVSWRPLHVLNSTEILEAVYYLLISEEEQDLTEGELLQNRSTVSVFPLENVLNVTLNDLELNSTQFLLVLAALPDGYISTNRRVTRVTVAVQEPILTEGVHLAEVLATPSLEINVTSSEITFVAVSSDLPVLEVGWFLTGLSTDGSAFLVFIESLETTDLREPGFGPRTVAGRRCRRYRRE